MRPVSYPLEPGTPPVLVLDGEQRSALAVVRSLGHRGCTVHVGSSETHSLAGGSRFAASETRLPDPLAGTEDYCAALVEMLHACQARAVIPVTEASTLALLECADLFPGIALPTPDLQRFRRASDKATVLALARDLGIAVPDQWSTSGAPGDTPAIQADRFPLVVKPSRSIAGTDGSRRKVGVRYAHSPEELERVVTELGPAAGPLLLQSRIEGPGLGVFLLRWDGELRASFAHRRIREKPPSGGVSVRSESVALPAELLAQSRALLEALDWTGVAMVEYKYDTRSGRNYLMEINPRFWGSLQLAIDAGVDFPWYLLQSMLGRAIEPVHRWRVGIRSRWCWGEIDHLIARLRRSPGDLDLPRDDPGLFRTAVDILFPWRPRQRSDVFRVSDPLPCLRETLAWVRAL